MREAHAQRRARSIRRPRPAAPLRRRSRAARRRATAGSDRPAARPPPSGAGSCVSRGSAWTRWRKVCSMRLAKRASVGEPEPARELRRRQSARQLDQRERVAARLVEDPGLHPLVERPGDRRVQQHARRRRRRAPRSRAPAAPRARARRRTRAARTPIRPARPRAGAPRTRASARTPGRATARRRRCTRAAAPRRRRPAGSGPPTRRGSDPAAGRRSGRTPCSARRAAGSADARDGRASARTAHAGRRTRAPSRTRRPPPGRSGIPSRRPTGAAAGRSCRRPPRRGGPAPGSDPRARRRRVVPARRARCHGRATPTMTGGRRPCWPRIIARTGRAADRRCGASKSHTPRTGRGVGLSHERLTNSRPSEPV